MLLNDKAKKHGFLLDLDCLFDTRFSVLESIDKDKASALLENGYHYRERDDFEGFDIHEYRKRYENRDINILMNSAPTPVLMYLHETLSNYFRSAGSDGVVVKTELIINIYPYKLNEVELNDVVLCLKAKTMNMVPIRIINTPMENIHPAFLRDNVSYFWVYDWDKWLKTHYLELAKGRLDDVIMVCPDIMPLTKSESEREINRLIEERKELGLPDEGDVELELKNSEIISNVIRMFIGNTFEPAKEFSIFLPDDFEEVLEQSQNKE